MRVLRRFQTAHSDPLRWVLHMSLAVVPLLAMTTLSYSAGATPVAQRADQAFILEVSAGQGRVAYSGECDVIDSMGAKRRKPIEGFTEDRLRFVGTEVSCRLRGQNGVSLTATLSHDQGAVTAVAMGGALSIAAH